MTLEQLENLCDELLVSKCDASPMLSAFTDIELLDAYDGILRQYGLELAVGAYHRSEWINGQLLIAANEGPIKACAAAFLAVLVEMDRRGLEWPGAVHAA
jgi:hypothetical protein